jgi:RNA polymerase sigma-70 factor (ECF subfamily)
MSKARGLPGHTDRDERQPQPPEAERPAEPEARFTQLYEENFDFVWRSVRMLGLPPDSADDAAQDVFVVAHRRLSDFEGRSGARTWLFAIALRVVSDFRRSRRRKLRLLERAMTMEPEPANTPYEAAVGTERRDALLTALDGLPDEQRAVFVLADVEEMSAPEIATALEVNLNTVYSRLRSARKTMAARMTKLGMTQGLRPDGDAS